MATFVQLGEHEFQMLPCQPSTSANQQAFERELELALQYSKEHGDAKVSWRHNGVPVDTDMDRTYPGAWARFTELNSAMCN